MKILSIGNSFSEDAHRWLHKLAATNSAQVDTLNLYIGGCSLEMHWTNVLENNAYYDLQRNGGGGERKISIAEALALEQWDIVTLQQASHFSGIAESYEPYLENLAQYIRNALPDTRLYFHQTWSYETDSDHGGFASYNNDQTEMYRRIKEVSETAAQAINAEIIPVGSVIQHLRETVTEFDYKNGGLSLCRDGFHLSLDYGRYAAAATWLHTLTGKDVVAQEFEGFDLELLKKITAVVNNI